MTKRRIGKRIVEGLRRFVEGLKQQSKGDIFQVWPQGWPRYRQPSSTEDCDVVVGPCACGARHSEGEFRCEQGTLFRYGKPTQEPSP